MDSERRREYYREYQKTPKYRARRGEYDRRYREKNREKIREQERKRRKIARMNDKLAQVQGTKPSGNSSMGGATIKERKLTRIRAVAERHRAGALAPSSGLGRTALVFDDNDVVDLLRIAVEREGGQGAFARHSGVNRPYLNRVLNGKEPPGRSIAKSLGLRKVYLVG